MGNDYTQESAARRLAFLRVETGADLPHVANYTFDPSLLLSSDAKCNTPRRFDIGKVVQDLKECCHAILFAPVGGRKRPDRRFAGRGAVDRGHCPPTLAADRPHRIFTTPVVL